MVEELAACRVEADGRVGAVLPRPMFIHSDVAAKKVALDLELNVGDLHHSEGAVRAHWLEPVLIVLVAVAQVATQAPDVSSWNAGRPQVAPCWLQ